MFTGLIEALGQVAHVDAHDGGGRALRIETTLGGDLRDGDSIAVNGVCLTVTGADAGGFGAHISPETLRVTTMGDLVPGRAVNLERPLRADARLGGHFVLGHVDGVGYVTAHTAGGDGEWLEIDAPAAVARYCISKGSIAIDGISLTIATLAGSCVRVQIVPFTSSHTNVAGMRVGDRVNLEADVLGKYVERLLRDTATPADRTAVPATYEESNR